MSTNSENRFSDRVENYIKYRPHYPQEVIDVLLKEKFVQPGDTVADIGSGTGISSLLFLKNNFKVVGVEPNDAMRQASEDLLKEYLDNGNFVAVNGNDVNTRLNEHSTDLIIAAQAFHWFDKAGFKTECKRILKSSGHVALIWNDRRTEGNDFLKLYEEFLQMFAIDYQQVNHKNTQDKKILDDFFGKDNYKEIVLENHQDVDLLGLRGRVLSSSYMPNEGHPDYDHMMYVLRKLFQRYQENNKVRLEYDTRIFIGQIK